MKLTRTKLSGQSIILPDVHEDERGFFMETYRKDKFADMGIHTTFVQDSHSHSRKGVLRGLKFQFDAPTDKLVRVAEGEIFAVGVDLRVDSETFGQWEGFELSEKNKLQLYLPFGFAFGFCVTSDLADVLYKLSAVHNAGGSGTIRWNDPDINITWPIQNPIVAPGDMLAPTLREWKDSPVSKLFGGKHH